MLFPVYVEHAGLYCATSFTYRPHVYPAYRLPVALQLRQSSEFRLSLSRCNTEIKLMASLPNGCTVTFRLHVERRMQAIEHTQPHPRKTPQTRLIRPTGGAVRRSSLADTMSPVRIMDSPKMAKRWYTNDDRLSLFTRYKYLSPAHVHGKHDPIQLNWETLVLWHEGNERLDSIRHPVDQIFPGKKDLTDEIIPFNELHHNTFLWSSASVKYSIVKKQHELYNGDAMAISVDDCLSKLCIASPWTIECQECLLNPFVHNSDWVSTQKLQAYCYKDENDVCVLHIDRVFVRYLKTGVQKTLVSQEL
ncbi:hypothetical protein CLF_113549 [Clonorchis sinensis]|uniref:Uncharacterized protein n=1 Tax=Clonorchis sinensis TaxID=79923 RepID=G7YYT5_CLOSI|nr:hypothetical protein CLF_113549 [Clonorchis sinensis]